MTCKVKQLATQHQVEYTNITNYDRTRQGMIYNHLGLLNAFLSNYD